MGVPSLEVILSMNSVLSSSVESRPSGLSIRE
jgi:hypothetical protein